MRALTALLAFILAAASLCTAQSSELRRIPTSPLKRATALDAPPETIFFNGVIYTGEGLAEDKPQTVQAMAIGGGKVLAIGTNDEVKRLAGTNTRLRDLKTATAGVFAFPGFNDAHTHLGGAGRTRLSVDLTGAQSLGEMQVRVEASAKAAQAGHWLTGGGWDHTLWTQKTLPTRSDIDKAAGNHPAFFERIDGHIALANTAALKAAGITGKTVAPKGGAIDKGARGEPTGILRESAKGLVSRVIPAPSQDERLRGAELAIADALAHGGTSVQDFSEWEDFLVFEKLEGDGKLTLRITEWLSFNAPLEKLKQMRAHHDPDDPLLHTGMLKGFMDGSLGSRTAAMKAPFADDSGNTGLPQFTQADLNKMAMERAHAGFQLGFHAIGDRAAAMALNAYSQTVDKCPDLPIQYKKPAEAPTCWGPLAEGARDRIEHAQVVDPADIPRFAKLGVIASMQPNHLLTDMNWAEDRLGPKRAAYSYAWKAFLDAGVHLAFGTDYPVEPITPFRGLYAAVTRMNEAGTKSYFPENKLTRGQALYAYTQGSAYAEFAEEHKGKLLPGYDADFILLDRDLYTVDAPRILKTKVLETFVAGQQVYADGIHNQ